MNILVTGGAGYIGSHTVIELIAAGHSVTVVDNLVNSTAESLKRVEVITGQTIPFYEIDLQDTRLLNTVFHNANFDAVIHFAGLKAVGESVQQPLLYYRTNIDSTLTLLETMNIYGVRKIVFSSSATVYGTPESLPLTEDSAAGIGLTNPYGKTKFMIEEILRDCAVTNEGFSASILRYFNPIGAHESGMIGENPKGKPNNIMPFIAQVAVGHHDALSIFGNDYDTPDGTGVRDYVHVVDLARGHVAAITHMKEGAHAYNLGTGHGTSVLELATAFEKVSGRDIPHKIMPRRAGDIAACYADVTKAAEELGWTAKKTIEDACRDSWRWQSQNPNGYTD